MGDFTLLAAASVYNTEDDAVDYAYAASGSVKYDPVGISLTFSTGGYTLDDGDDPSNFYAKVGWDTSLIALGETGFGFDYTKGKNISSDGADGTSFGLATVQKIDRFGIDLYAQLRWYELDDPENPGLKNVTVGTFGTKFTF